MSTTVSSSCSAARLRPTGRWSCRAAFLVLVLATAVLCRSSDGAEPPISASVAALFVGEEKTVEGTVTHAARDGNVVRLHFGPPPHALVVSLIVGLLSDFPPAPERYYLGQSVRVVGTIRSFRGTPEIVIHDPARIQLARGAPAVPATPAAPAGGDASALREEIGVLKERLRMLEDQLRRVEGGRSPAGE